MVDTFAKNAALLRNTARGRNYDEVLRLTALIAKDIEDLERWASNGQNATGMPFWPQTADQPMPTAWGA